MKKIFLIAGIVSFTVAAAQDNGSPKIKVVPPKPKNNISSKPPTYYVKPQTQLLGNAELLNTLPNGNKVYALPQDNMPCVVPDVSQYNMPVVKPQVEAYTIPNAYPQAPSKPIIMTEEQLKQLLQKQMEEKQKLHR
jgi:hypothetical protein